MKGSLNLWLLVVVIVAALSWGFGRTVWSGADEGPTRGADRVTDDGGSDDQDTPETPVHLLVLNGTPQAGLAREFSLLLGQAGCVVDQVGNGPHDRFAQTILINRRLTARRAGELARLIGDVPVLQEFDGRTAADVVLVIGADAERVRRELGTAVRRLQAVE